MSPPPVKDLVKEIRPGVMGTCKGYVMDVFCQDCKVPEPAWFMVKDDVWLQAFHSKRDGVICWLCLEKRLGRKLVPEDLELNNYLNISIQLGIFLAVERGWKPADVTEIKRRESKHT